MPPPPPPPKSQAPAGELNTKLEKRVSDQHTQLAAARTQRDKLQTDLRELRANLEESRNELKDNAKNEKALQSRVTELEVQLKTAEPQPAPKAAAQPQPAPAKVDNGEVDTLRSRVKELEAKLEAAPAKRPADDLKLIRGVGPGYERALIAAGVTSFAQLAAWSQDDADRIAELINVNPARMTRDRWIEHAAELARG